MGVSFRMITAYGMLVEGHEEDDLDLPDGHQLVGFGYEDETWTAVVYTRSIQEVDVTRSLKEPRVMTDAETLFTDVVLEEMVRLGKVVARSPIGWIAGVRVC